MRMAYETPWSGRILRRTESFRRFLVASVLTFITDFRSHLDRRFQYRYVENNEQFKYM